MAASGLTVCKTIGSAQLESSSHQNIGTAKTCALPRQAQQHRADAYAWLRLPWPSKCNVRSRTLSVYRRSPVLMAIVRVCPPPRRR